MIWLEAFWSEQEIPSPPSRKSQSNEPTYHLNRKMPLKESHLEPLEEQKPLTCKLAQQSTCPLSTLIPWECSTLPDGTLHSSSAPFSRAFLQQRLEGLNSQGESRGTESLQLWKSCVKYREEPQTCSSVLKSESAPDASAEAFQLLSSLLGIDLGKQVGVRRHALLSILRINSALERVGCTGQLSNTLLKSPEILYPTLKFIHSQSCSWLGLWGAEDVCPGGTLSYTPRKPGLVTVCPCTAGQWAVWCQPQGKVKSF